MIDNIIAIFCACWTVTVMLLKHNNIIVTLVMFLVLSLVEYGIYYYAYNKKYTVKLWLIVLVRIVAFIPLLLAIYLYKTKIISQITASIIIIVCVSFLSAFMGMDRAGKRLKEEIKQEYA
jgi:hypothetical protein